MSDTLQALLEQEGPLAVLEAFGLDQVLTEQDDPWLWAAALVRHWPAPGEPDMQPAALRFGIGRIVPEVEQGEASLARSGMEQLEEWCFERLDENHLQVVKCGSQPAVSFLGMVMSGDPSALTDPAATWVKEYLDLSRPSMEAGTALVHAGMSAPPSVGRGETRYWRRQGDTWAETGEVYSQWLT